MMTAATLLMALTANHFVCYDPELDLRYEYAAASETEEALLVIRTPELQGTWRGDEIEIEPHMDAPSFDVWGALPDDGASRRLVGLHVEPVEVREPGVAEPFYGAYLYKSLSHAGDQGILTAWWFADGDCLASHR